MTAPSKLSSTPGRHCFSGNNELVKQPGDIFDVATGFFVGAEVCELVGLYLFDQQAEILGKKNAGLYRDDGLAGIKSGSGPAIERTRKKITKLFQQDGLQITSKCNLAECDVGHIRVKTIFIINIGIKTDR